MQPTVMETTKDGLWQSFGMIARRATGAARTVVSTLIRRAAERQEVLALDWRARRDIGFGSCEVRNAAEKPLWRA